MEEKLAHSSWLEAYELEKDYEDDEGEDKFPTDEGGLVCPGRDDDGLICD